MPPVSLRSRRTHSEKTLFHHTLDDFRYSSRILCDPTIDHEGQYFATIPEEKLRYYHIPEMLEICYEDINRLLKYPVKRHLLKVEGDELLGQTQKSIHQCLNSVFSRMENFMKVSVAAKPDTCISTIMAERNFWKREFDIVQKELSLSEKKYDAQSLLHLQWRKLVHTEQHSQRLRYMQVWSKLIGLAPPREIAHLQRDVTFFDELVLLDNEVQKQVKRREEELQLLFESERQIQSRNALEDQKEIKSLRHQLSEHEEKVLTLERKLLVCQHEQQQHLLRLSEYENLNFGDLLELQGENADSERDREHSLPAHTSVLLSRMRDMPSQSMDAELEQKLEQMRASIRNDKTFMLRKFYGLRSLCEKQAELLHDSIEQTPCATKEEEKRRHIVVHILQDMSSRIEQTLAEMNAGDAQKDKIEVREDVLTALTNKVSLATTERNLIQARVEEYDHRMGEMRLEVAQLRADADLLRSANEMHEEQSSKMHLERNDLFDDIASTQAKNMELKVVILELQKQVTSQDNMLESTVAEALHKVESAEKQVEEFRNALEEETRQHSDVRREALLEREKLNICEEKNEFLSVEVQVMTDERLAYERMLDEMMAEHATELGALNKVLLRVEEQILEEDQSRASRSTIGDIVKQWRANAQDVRKTSIEDPQAPDADVPKEPKAGMSLMVQRITGDKHWLTPPKGIGSVDASTQADGQVTCTVAGSAFAWPQVATWPLPVRTRISRVHGRSTNARVAVTLEDATTEYERTMLVARNAVFRECDRVRFMVYNGRAQYADARSLDTASEFVGVFTKLRAMHVSSIEEMRISIEFARQQTTSDLVALRFALDCKCCEMRQLKLIYASLEKDIHVLWEVMQLWLRGKLQRLLRSLAVSDEEFEIPSWLLGSFASAAAEVESHENVAHRVEKARTRETVQAVQSLHARAREVAIELLPIRRYAVSVAADPNESDESVFAILLLEAATLKSAVERELPESLDEDVSSMLRLPPADVAGMLSRDAATQLLRCGDEMTDVSEGDSSASACSTDSDREIDFLAESVRSRWITESGFDDVRRRTSALALSSDPMLEFFRKQWTEEENAIAQETFENRLIIDVSDFVNGRPVTVQGLQPLEVPPLTLSRGVTKCEPLMRFKLPDGIPSEVVDNVECVYTNEVDAEEYFASVASEYGRGLSGDRNTSFLQSGVVFMGQKKPQEKIKKRMEPVVDGSVSPKAKKKTIRQKPPSQADFSREPPSLLDFPHAMEEQLRDEFEDLTIAETEEQADEPVPSYRSTAKVREVLAELVDCGCQASMADVVQKTQGVQTNEPEVERFEESRRAVPRHKKKKSAEPRTKAPQPSENGEVGRMRDVSQSSVQNPASNDPPRLAEAQLPRSIQGLRGTEVGENAPPCGLPQSPAILQEMPQSPAILRETPQSPAILRETSQSPRILRETTQSPRIPPSTNLPQTLAAGPVVTQEGVVSEMAQSHGVRAGIQLQEAEVSQLSNNRVHFTASGLGTTGENGRIASRSAPQKHGFSEERTFLTEGDDMHARLTSKTEAPKAPSESNTSACSGEMDDYSSKDEYELMEVIDASCGTDGTWERAPFLIIEWLKLNLMQNQQAQLYCGEWCVSEMEMWPSMNDETCYSVLKEFEDFLTEIMCLQRPSKYEQRRGLRKVYRAKKPQLAASKAELDANVPSESEWPSWSERGHGAKRGGNIRRGITAGLTRELDGGETRSLAVINAGDWNDLEYNIGRILGFEMPAIIVGDIQQDVYCTEYAGQESVSLASPCRPKDLSLDAALVDRGQARTMRGRKVVGRRDVKNEDVQPEFTASAEGDDIESPTDLTGRCAAGFWDMSAIATVCSIPERPPSPLTFPVQSPNRIRRIQSSQLETRCASDESDSEVVDVNGLQPEEAQPRSPQKLRAPGIDVKRGKLARMTQLLERTRQEQCSDSIDARLASVEEIRNSSAKILFRYKDSPDQLRQIQRKVLKIARYPDIRCGMDKGDRHGVSKALERYVPDSERGFFVSLLCSIFNTSRASKELLRLAFQRMKKPALLALPNIPPQRPEEVEAEEEETTPMAVGIPASAYAKAVAKPPRNWQKKNNIRRQGKLPPKALLCTDPEIGAVGWSYAVNEIATSEDPGATPILTEPAADERWELQHWRQIGWKPLEEQEDRDVEASRVLTEERGATTPRAQTEEPTSPTRMFPVVSLSPTSFGLPPISSAR